MRRLVDGARRSEAINRAGWWVIDAMARAGRRAEWLARRWRVAGPVTVEVEGFCLRMVGRCDDICLDALRFGHPWARGELRLFATLAPRARTVLDIGANTGVFTLLAARANDLARVVAFEPHPANLERLGENLRLNGLDERVELVGTALGSADGKVSLTVPADGALSDVASVIGDFTRAHYGIDYTSIEVAQTTLDEASDRLGLIDVDLVKLDVEYHEGAALEGAHATLERWSPVVLAEVFNHDVFVREKPELAGRLAPDNAPRVEAIMGGLGYHSYAVAEHGLLSVPNLRTLPSGASNFLFSKVALERTYTPFSERAAIESLLPLSG